MYVDLECGCCIDDENFSTVHEDDGHYPIGAGPESFCKRCDLFHPTASCGENLEK